jgi:antitoxin HicB
MSNVVALPNEAVVVEYLRQPYARIILPETDGTFRGEILEFPGCISTGDSAAEALSRLEEAAKGWLHAALEAGQNIPKPVESSNDYSGRLVLRLPKSLHKKAALVAEREGVSLNQLIVSSLAESVGESNQTTNNITAVQYVSNVTITGAFGTVGTVGAVDGGYLANTASLSMGTTLAQSVGTIFVGTGPWVTTNEGYLSNTYNNPLQIGQIGRANAGT